MRGPRPGRALAAQPDQTQHPTPVRSVRLEQLEHRGVVTPGLTEEHPTHLVGEVEVPDAHRVGVTERDPRHLGDGPLPDPGDGSHAGRDRPELVDGLVESVPSGGDASHGVGPLPLDAGAVILPDREGHQSLGIRGEGQAHPLGRRSGVAVDRDQGSVRRPRVLADDLLLEHGRHQGFDQRPRTRDAEALVTAVGITHELDSRGVDGLDAPSEVDDVVGLAHELARVLDRPGRADPPGVGAQSTRRPLRHQVEGGRALGGEGGPPRLGGREPEGGVALPTLQRTEGRPEVERTGEAERGHRLRRGHVSPRRPIRWRRARSRSSPACCAHRTSPRPAW